VTGFAIYEFFLTAGPTRQSHIANRKYPASGGGGNHDRSKPKPVAGLTVLLCSPPLVSSIKPKKSA
jgi:hypothetical protein